MQSSQQNERRHLLPALTRVPSEKELVGMLHQSITKRGEMLELPIDYHPQVSLRLQAVVGRRAGEEAPTWYLYSDCEEDSKLEWIHQTGDMSHILGLINNAVEQLDSDSSQFDSGNKPVFRPFDANQIIEPVEEEEGVIEGDLTLLPVEALLQSVTSSKLTGKLECKTGLHSAYVFFEDGNPKNAYCGTTVGEEAVVDLMTWKEGHFSFFPNQTVEERTILKPISALLLEAATLTDFTTFLDKAGLKADSILARAEIGLSETQFEEKLARAVPIDMNKQKKFYHLVDDTISLGDLIDSQKLSRSLWVPLVYNLVSTGIVTIRQPPPKSKLRKSRASGTGSSAIDLGLNRTTIDSFARSHIYSDSGVISYVAFLYFIEQEFYRYECFRSPFSLVLVRPKLRSLDGEAPAELEVDKEMLQEVIGRVNLTKRKADLLAHYQNDSYALLLPHTNLQGVTAFAGRLVGALMSSPFAVGKSNEEKKLVLTVGIASLPENCEDWVSLVAYMHNNQRRFEA